MNTNRNQELLAIAKEWAIDQIDAWISDYHAWDYLVGEELTEEDYEWIQDNVKFNISVEEIKDVK